jgi:phage baseplate assembly protein W
MPGIKEIIYKDFPISFSAHPVTGNLSVLKDVDAVKQSVKNIVLTNFYERPYASLLGGNVRAQLFENIDRFTEYTIAKNIKIALNNYEPRVTVEAVRVSAEPDENGLNISVVFRVHNNTNPITVNVFIERVR